MKASVASVWAGLAVAVAACWSVDPLWSLLPAACLVAFGLFYPEGE